MPDPAAEHRSFLGYLRPLNRRPLSVLVPASAVVLLTLCASLWLYRAFAPDQSAIGRFGMTYAKVETELLGDLFYRACDTDEDGVDRACETKSIPRSVREPYVLIEVSHAAEVRSGSAAEISLRAEPITDKPTIRDPAPDRIHLSFVSEALQLTPASVELPISAAMPQVARFQVPERDQLSPVVIGIRGAWLSPGQSAERLPAGERFDVGKLGLTIHPVSRLPAPHSPLLARLQGLFAGLGAAGLALCGLMALANRNHLGLGSA